MAEYSNDEERLAAIADFFKHYKNLILSLLISISVIGIGAFGIKYTNDSNNAAASKIYAEWLKGINQEGINIINENLYDQHSFQFLIIKNYYQFYNLLILQ